MNATIQRAGISAALVIAAMSAYLLAWPIPAEPLAWPAPSAPAATGPIAPNARLRHLRAISLGSEVGPEHLAVGPDGKLYAAVSSGRILRMELDGSKQEVFASTGGRVLGFDFDAEGRLIAADALRGIFSITPDGRATLLTDRVAANDPIQYADGLVVAPSGTIYFTDASTRFPPRRYGGTLDASVLEIMEQSASGRVLAYDPKARQTRVVARGFSLANGIVVAADGHTLLVAETGRYRIWKVDGRASNVEASSGSPQAVPLLENLPGYPDNLMRGRDGRIWVGLFRPRNAKADGLATKPFVRKILLRLPRAWLPIPEARGHVLAIDEQGRIVEDLQDPVGAYPETTGATETAERLYLHSLHAPGIAWLPR